MSAVVGEPYQCTVDASFELRFIKSMWLKSVVESQTTAEMEKWFNKFLEHVRKVRTECC